MAMAQPSTETPALRFVSGAPRPKLPIDTASAAGPLASAEPRGCMAGAAKQRHAVTCGRRSGAKRAVRTAWRSAMMSRDWSAEQADAGAAESG
eukprot:CAMPEP_0115427272 /NCGR_PEP_ID=MMETSP0271-20121206/29359_1 /TAXON_ID=71861 /ORGANISM="Scrippsiella trochoidea, Strain CCMP3099" /LENGTH=92 /DNA_ID=CAMNT_0002852295 /DNA_START=77 /DNA_END=351 /DNA_ORIENTATION=-